MPCKKRCHPLHRLRRQAHTVGNITSSSNTNSSAATIELFTPRQPTLSLINHRIIRHEVDVINGCHQAMT
jgi:hypothetical protein